VRELEQILCALKQLRRKDHNAGKPEIGEYSEAGSTHESLSADHIRARIERSCGGIFGSSDVEVKVVGRLATVKVVAPRTRQRQLLVNVLSAIEGSHTFKVVELHVTTVDDNVLYYLHLSVGITHTSTWLHQCPRNRNVLSV
jgi:hypothetical protein